MWWLLPLQLQTASWAVFAGPRVPVILVVCCPPGTVNVLLDFQSFETTRSCFWSVSRFRETLCSSIDRALLSRPRSSCRFPLTSAEVYGHFD